MKKLILLAVCFTVLFCGCFSYNVYEYSIQAEKYLNSNTLNVACMQYLNEQEKNFYIREMYRVAPSFDNVRDKKQAQRILSEYKLRLIDIYADAEDINTQKGEKINSFNLKLIDFSQWLCGLDFLTTEEKNLFSQLLFIDDLKQVDFYEMDLRAEEIYEIVDKIHHASYTLNWIREDANKKNKEVKEEYRTLIDEFVLSTEIDLSSGNAEVIESAVMSLEREYIMLIAYIQFKTELEDNG